MKLLKLKTNSYAVAKFLEQFCCEELCSLFAGVAGFELSGVWLGGMNPFGDLRMAGNRYYAITRDGMVYLSQDGGDHTQVCLKTTLANFQAWLDAKCRNRTFALNVQQTLIDFPYGHGACLAWLDRLPFYKFVHIAKLKVRATLYDFMIALAKRGVSGEDCGKYAAAYRGVPCSWWSESIELKAAIAADFHFNGVRPFNGHSNAALNSWATPEISALLVTFPRSTEAIAAVEAVFK